MAFTRDHRAIEHIARSLLVGTALLGDSLEETVVPSLLFGSEVNAQGPDVHLKITANTWFESDYIVEARCTEDHLVHGKSWGIHISWACPQFRAQAKRFQYRKVSEVTVEDEVLLVRFDERMRWICDGTNEDDIGGWCLGGKVQMYIAQLGGTTEPYGSIPDEVQAAFSSGWEWTKDD